MLGKLLYLALVLSVALLPACARETCYQGAALDMGKLSALRSIGLPSAGPRASLILPNPIDATDNPFANVSDMRVLQSANILTLAGLSLPTRLENSFLKIRVRDITDALSTLATPNSGSDYNYKPGDIHYSETMGYRSITSIQAYVEALGFSITKSRPLYVMVQASGSTSQDVNAYYDHAYLNPGQPRTIRLYGSSQFAPGMDQDIYWHEFGHMVNESVSGERGIDYAGDSGAVWTEGSALHECLADYLAESVSGRGYIGKWVARNFNGFQAGQPLRSAEDPNGQKVDFRTLITADGTGARPERYEVAEWCSRVLWEIRESFVRQNSQTGAIYSDRMIYSAASLLGRDASLSQFQSALMESDEQLHCGGHQEAIVEAFESRGFTQPSKLEQPLALSANPVTVRVTSTGVQAVAPAPGSTVVFNMSIRNPNGSTARNVRVRLEPKDARLFTTTYQQGYGDLPAGRAISIGVSNGLSSDFSVVGEIDSKAVRGQQVGYRLRVMSENSKETVIEGVIRL